MTDDICIREVTESDAEALRTYACELFAENLPGILRRDPPTLEDELGFIRSHTERPGSIMLAAESDGRIVGLVGLQSRPLEQERHVGVFGLSVASGHRGRGIGTALVKALEERAPGLGITRIEGEAVSLNPRAITLYERLGFTREGVRRGALDVDGERADMVMLARLL